LSNWAIFDIDCNTGGEVDIFLISTSARTAARSGVF